MTEIPPPPLLSPDGRQFWNGGEWERMPPPMVSTGDDLPIVGIADDSPSSSSSQRAAIVSERPDSRHGWMLGCSLVTLGLGVLAVANGEWVLGVLLLAAFGAAAYFSRGWLYVSSLSLAPKLLVWGVGILGCVAGSFLIAMTWFTLKLLQFMAERIGADLGLSRMPGPFSLLRRVPAPSSWASGRYSAAAQWDRILGAEAIGGERVVRDGGFIYIGGERVHKDGGFTYVGNQRVVTDGGVLRIGNKVVSQDGSSLFIDGERVHE